MNFFKSILSDDPDPPKSESPHDSDSNSPEKRNHGDTNPNDVAQDDAAGVWNFGGLIKTLTTRSESVLETYRRDLQEFGSGLKKETEIFREAASRAVKDLPASLEAGASVAHGALDGVLKSTAEIISKEAASFVSDGESETPETNRSANSARYSWFESQLVSIHNDLNTFCEDPEDVEEYKKWKLGFKLEEKSDEIEYLIGENGILEGVYRKSVPSAVDHGTFWCRYFYRVEKLKQQERVRANIMKRAITVDDEEELSWDVDDDEDDDVKGSGRTSDVKVKGVAEVGDKAGNADGTVNPVARQESSNGNSRHDKGEEKAVVDDANKNNVEDVNKKEVEESSKKSNEDMSSGVKEVKPEGDVAQVKNEEKVKSEEIVVEKDRQKLSMEKSEMDKKTDVSVVPAHESSKVEEEEDLGWDDFEDMGSGDEKKASATTHGGSPNKDELRKRLSVADDDEDLSWDIEDDDEPVKA